MKLKAFWKLVLGLAAAVLILTAAFSASFLLSRDLYSNFQWVGHSYQIINATHLIHQKLSENESNVRAFSITKNTSFLDEYHQNIVLIHKDLATLIDLTQDNPTTLQYLASLKQLVEQRISLLNQTLGIAQSGGFDSQPLLVSRLQQGKQVMDQLRIVFDQIEGHEQHLLKQRKEHSAQQSTNTIHSIVVAGGAALLLIIVALIILWRDNEQRLKAEKQLWKEKRFSTAITKATPNLLLVYDMVEQRNVYANKDLFSFLGYAPDEVKKENDFFTELLHPDDAVNLPKINASILQGQDQDVFSWEYRIRHKAGHYVWLQSREVIFARDSNHIPTQKLAVIQDITQVKNSLASLAHSEARYRTTIENAQDFIYEINYQGYFTFANPVIERITEYSSEELLAMHYWEVIPKSYRQEVKDFYTKQFVTRTSTTYKELPILTKTGKLLWLGQNTTFEFDGAYLKTIRVIARDLTEIKAVQRETNELQQLVSTVLDNSLAGIVALHTVRNDDGSINDFRLLLMNKAAENISQRRAKEIIGKTFSEIYLDGEPEGLYESYCRVVESGEPEFFEKYIPVTHGYSWLQFVVAKMGDGLVVTYYDINTQKQAQVQIEKQKTFYETILNQLPNDIAVYDSERRYQFVNPKAIKNKIVRQWIIGRDDFDYCSFRGIDTGLAVERNKRFEEVLTKQSQIEWEEEEISPEAVSSYYLRRLSPVYDQTNSLQMLIDIGVDITERKYMEQELIKAREKALESVHAKDMFLSNMSHEIRTPLNAVIGMTHLLLEEDPRPDQWEHLRLLQFSATNLLVLINDILDYSKIEAGKIVFESISFSLRELINSIIHSHSFKTEEKGIQLLLEYPASLKQMLIGDPVRLAQILNNLVSNAVKFTETGSVKLRIEILAEDEHQITLQFDIEDTGIGIPWDKLTSIFESFTQASSDTTRKYGGTGLGLAITKRLLELQESGIEVKSTVGKGTTFYFPLTLSKSDQLEQEAQAFPSFINTAVNSLSHVRLLLVEDNKANQIVATKFLKKWGITPDYAVNGIMAIEKASTHTYDIILMDLQMPEMDGYQATKYIRQMDGKSLHQLPIIALTASAMLDVKDKVFNTGMNDYLPKPFNPKELYQKITKYVYPSKSGNVVASETGFIVPYSIQSAPSTPNHSVNFQAVMDMAPDDLDFQQDMAQIYVETFKELQQEYPAKLAQRDIDQLKDIRHKLHPTLKTLQLDDLLQLLHHAGEVAMIPGNQQELAVLSDKIQFGCEQVLTALQSIIQSLETN